MSRGVLDGDFYGHPKAVHAWSLHHASIGVWAFGVSYAHRHGTRGFVSEAFVSEKLPAKREREAVIAALTSVAPGQRNPLWTPVDGGWQIHNFDRRSEPRTPEQEESIRAARSKAGAKGAANRWQSARGKDDVCQTVAISDKEKLTRLRGRSELLSLSNRLAMAMRRNDPQAHIAPESFRWLDAARLLIDQDGRTVGEVERIIDWSQADGFWRSNILSMPKLREKFPQLALRAKGSARTTSDLDERDAAALSRLIEVAS